MLLRNFLQADMTAQGYMTLVLRVGCHEGVLAMFPFSQTSVRCCSYLIINMVSFAFQYNQHTGIQLGYPLAFCSQLVRRLSEIYERGVG